MNCIFKYEFTEIVKIWKGDHQSKYLVWVELVGEILGSDTSFNSIYNMDSGFYCFDGFMVVLIICLSNVKIVLPFLECPYDQLKSSAI